MGKNIALGCLAVLAVVFGVLQFSTPQQITVNVPPQQVIGASTLHTQFEKFSGGIGLGGNVQTITATLATTTYITAAHACGGSVLAVTPSVTAASILYLPTASAMITGCLQNIGDNVTFVVKNLTASTTVVTPQNTSTTLVYDAATGGSTSTPASGYSRITLYHYSNGSTGAVVGTIANFKP